MKRYNEEIIKTIIRNIPEKENASLWLSNVLKVERESAYRRLRGDVIFTFDEIALISSQLGFSIDNIVGSINSKQTLFDLHWLKQSDYINGYAERIMQFSNVFQKLTTSENAKAKIAHNSMPHLFTFSKKILAKFRFFKWVYQTQKLPFGYLFKDVIFPQSISDAQDHYVEMVRRIPDFTIIFDENVFTSLIKDILFFRKQKLIFEEEQQQMKCELHEIVDLLEDVMAEGRLPNGGKVEIYLSATDIETTYMYYECDCKEISVFRVYSISALDSYDKNVCIVQKEWIESLKRFSTLISQSAELTRFEYLNTQREHIERL